MSDALVKSLREWTNIFMRHSMRDFMLFAKEKNYSMAQVNALFRIHHKGSCGVSDLGEAMGVTSAAASQLLERLVQQGLAVRTEDPQDRRNKLITLTESGEKILQEMIAARQEWFSHLTQLFTVEEQAQIATALQLLIQKAEQLEQA
ncbi:MAG: hypothetical protein OHK0052_24960 [Anaerolineales bacterium]